MVCIKKQPYIYYVRLTFKNRHFFRYLTCLLDRGHIKGYQLVINNIKKRKEIVKRYQAYLDSIENIMSLDDLDIFRQEEADHEETGEPFDRSDDPNFWR